MSPIEEAAVPALKRQYPHVDDVQDWRAQQSIRLLWDRVFDLEGRLQAAQTTITSLVGASNTNETAIAETAQQAREALALSQRPGEAADSSTSTAEELELPGGGDGGGGQEGCAAGLPTGHDTGGLLNAIRAGQLVCGTGNEFIALRNPVPDLDTRKTNAEELLRRMIWHLKEAGFSAGRQRNPSGLISKDKLTVVVDSVLRAYDVFIDYDNFGAQMQTHMGETAPPNMVDDAGIPDS